MSSQSTPSEPSRYVVALSLPHHDDKLAPPSRFPFQRVDPPQCQLLTVFVSAGRCYDGGKLWPSRRPDGACPSEPRPLQQVHDLQPEEPRLGEPRPFCSLVRPIHSLSNAPADGMSNSYLCGRTAISRTCFVVSGISLIMT
jgi:hypothetical protein